MVIYVITNIVNGKKYVGQTRRTSQERWKEHCKPEKCVLLRRAIEKYGKNSFTVTDVDTADTPEELNRKETEWILKLNTLAPNGYNLQVGGKNGLIAEETRKKISNSHKGKHLSEAHKKALSIAFSGKNHPLYGTKMSQETKDKISKANKGRLSGEKNPHYGIPNSKEIRQKISEKNKLYYKNTLHHGCLKVLCVETGKIYPSATHAFRETGIDNSQIGKVCRGVYKTAGKLHWEYVVEGVT